MRGAGVLLLGLCVGCFAPTPQPGAPCTNGACPTGLVCASATLTCEVRELVADAATTPDDASADPDAALLTPPDAPPDAQQCFGAGLV